MMKKILFLLAFMTVFIILGCKTSTENRRFSDASMIMSDNTEASSTLITLYRELKIAYDYYLKSDFKRVLRIYRKVAREYMKYDYRNRLATVYSNIGFVFLKLNRLADAEYYLKLSLMLSKKYINNPEMKQKMIAVNQYKLALLYLYKKELKKCKKLNDLSHKINLTVSPVIGISRNYRVYGLYYLQKKDYAKAKKYFLQAIYLNTRSNDYYDYILNRISIAKIYKMEKKYDKASRSLLFALKTAKSRELSEKVSLTLLRLAELEEAQNNFEKALSYYRRAYESDLNLDTDETIRKARMENSLNKVKEMYIKLNRRNDFEEYKKMINFFYYQSITTR
jgi:tetratricopeptide (TPR) repeat protein